MSVRSLSCPPVSLLVFLYLLLSVPVGGSKSWADPLVRAVGAVGMTVSDMDRALDFYTRVLPFELVADVEVAGRDYGRLKHLPFVSRKGNDRLPRLRVVRLRLGQEFVELTDYLEPEGRPLPEDARSNDRWFQHLALVVSDMDRAYEHLRQNAVQHVSPGPQTLPEWNAGVAGIRAFCFRDPDGHDLEILWFPPGKGDPRWQSENGALFLGIDHTAIVVGDTEASLRFYRSVLGLETTGQYESYGLEQEHLTSVFGARLRITSLRAAAGPGIELLEYLAPPGGRPVSDDARSNDLVHWETTLFVDDAGEVERNLRAAGALFISAATVSTPGAELGFERSSLVRDPDGHALHMVEHPTQGAAAR
jgi:catechol 2,3-dioxygenase-like lactoylglutathione lyase family enzyme